MDQKNQRINFQQKSIFLIIYDFFLSKTIFFTIFHMFIFFRFLLYR